jgi:hypothetical protein
MGLNISQSGHIINVKIITGSRLSFNIQGLTLILGI